MTSRATPTTITTHSQAMVDNAAFPKQSLFEKKGKGVFRRFFHFIPVRGPTAINRRIQHCNTVTGSKPHRAFVDIGVPGKVWMARRSCHQCDGCLQMDHSKCENKKYQLTEKGAEDPGGYVDLVPKKAGPGRAVTRGYLTTIGRSIADDLGTGHQGGVVVVVEMSAESEAWAICVTEGEVERVTESDAQEYPCFEPGDVVIRLKKYEPISPGSSSFDLTSKTILADVGDLRAVLSDAHFSVVVKRGVKDRRVLDPGAKHRILRLIPNIEV